MNLSMEINFSIAEHITDNVYVSFCVTSEDSTRPRQEALTTLSPLSDVAYPVRSRTTTGTVSACLLGVGPSSKPLDRLVV